MPCVDPVDTIYIEAHEGNYGWQVGHRHDCPRTGIVRTSFVRFPKHADPVGAKLCELRAAHEAARLLRDLAPTSVPPGDWPTSGLVGPAAVRSPMLRVRK